MKNMDKEENKKTLTDRLEKIGLLSIERESLENKLFEKGFKERVSGELKELSKNQPHVIRIIGLSGEIMPSTIGLYTGMEKSTLTRMVDDLQKKGLVYRKNDPEDRRKVMISLTEKGQACFVHLKQLAEENAEEILQVVDEKEIEEYVKSLENVVQFLRKLNGSLSK